jgi:hypothetical protein
MLEYFTRSRRIEARREEILALWKACKDITQYVLEDAAGGGACVLDRHPRKLCNAV